MAMTEEEVEGEEELEEGRKEDQEERKDEKKCSAGLVVLDGDG